MNAILGRPSALVCCIVLMVVQFTPSVGQSKEASKWIERKDYIVLVAEDTALQRFLGNRDANESCTNYLLIDGNALCSSLEEFDWDQLAEDLAGTTATPRKEPLWIKTYYAESAGKNSRILNWTLDGFARKRAKFGRVYQSEVHTALNESIGVARWVERTGNDKTVREDAVGNDYVDVYPVQTYLSRLQTNGAGCLVHIKPKFSSDFGEGLPRAIQTSMSVFVRNVKIDSKERVHFVFHYAWGEGDEAKKWFSEKGAAELAEAMGFKTWSITSRFE